MRPWHGLNLLASYTLGHAVDHVSGLNIGGESRPMLPVTIGDQASIDAALAREKGDALFDARHRFVLSFGYELPRLDDRGAADAARRSAAGRSNGIIQGQTGFPLTVDRADQRLADVADQPSQHDVRSERGRAAHDRAVVQHRCFQRLTLAANAGQVGNEARNVIRGPGFTRTDLSLFKNFAIAGTQQLQLRVEVVQPVQPGTLRPARQPRSASPTFGVITTADDGRIVQLGIKYTF